MDEPAPKPEQSVPTPQWIRARRRLWVHSLAASVVAVGLSLFGYALNHSALSEGLFLVVPICTGLAIAFMSRGRDVVAISAITSCLLSLSILALTGLEGIGCVILAFPIVFGGIGAGSLLGYLIGKTFIRKYGNVTVIALSLGASVLVGWTNGEPSHPEPLTVTSSMNFHAPIDEVWEAVRESGAVDGDDSLLRFLGLPVPYRCSVSDDGVRVCYFEE